ncbi:MAG: hypothetical protein JXQ75_07020 [Phycisphaerae bacterium]|nr:hypothetical protein [Phycisphaerae bacterium]
MADVYPNEAYPSDASIAVLDGTTDQTTGLTYIAKGVGPASTPSYETQYNRRQQRENRRLAVVTEGLVVDEGSLKIGIHPLNYTLCGVQKRFEGATSQSVPNDATRYVYVDASNALQVAASYPDDASTFVPLAKVTTSNGATAVECNIGYARVVVGPVVPLIGVSVGDESSDVIRVTLQLEDRSANPVARRWLAEIWLGDAAYGDLVATAPSGGVSVATGQKLGSDLVSNKHLKVISSSDGTVAIDIADTGTPTFYLMAVGGGADLVASDAVTFTA